MNPLNDDVKNSFKGMDEELEILEGIIKHALAIISEHEKQIESSDLK